jgi:hypothetical protein
VDRIALPWTASSLPNKTQNRTGGRACSSHCRRRTSSPGGACLQQGGRRLLCLLWETLTPQLSAWASIVRCRLVVQRPVDNGAMAARDTLCDFLLRTKKVFVETRDAALKTCEALNWCMRASTSTVLVFSFFPYLPVSERSIHQPIHPAFTGLPGGSKTIVAP